MIKTTLNHDCQAFIPIEVTNESLLDPTLDSSLVFFSLDEQLLPIEGVCGIRP